MAGPVSKFGDAQLAREVIEAYAAKVDNFTEIDCEELGIGKAKCDALCAAIGEDCRTVWPPPDGSGVGVIEPAERRKLKTAGFSDEFIVRLAGDKGTNLADARVKWLSDHIVNRWWRIGWDEGYRSWMLMALGRMGRRAVVAVDALMELIEKEPISGRLDAIDTLRAIVGPHFGEEISASGMERAVPAILKAVHENKIGKEDALMVFADIGPEAAAAVPFVAEHLDDDSPITRMYAIYAFNRITPTLDGFVPAVIGALGDDDPRVRIAAAFTLGGAGQRSHHALPFLEDMRDEPKEDPNCRQAAGEAVEKILKDVK